MGIFPNFWGENIWNHHPVIPFLHVFFVRFSVAGVGHQRYWMISIWSVGFEHPVVVDPWFKFTATVARFLIFPISRMSFTTNLTNYWNERRVEAQDWPRNQDWVQNQLATSFGFWCSSHFHTHFGFLSNNTCNLLISTYSRKNSRNSFSSNRNNNENARILTQNRYV